MPSAAFATGILDGAFGTIKSERDRKDKNALDMANLLISTGRVRDYNDLVEHIPQFQELFAGPDSKGGKKGGKNGAPDPHQMIGALINPILKKASQGGGDQQGGGQPQQGQPQGQGGGQQPQQPKLLSEQEATDRDQANAQQKRDADFADFKRRSTVTEAARIAEEQAKVHKGTADKEPSQNADGKWTIKVRDADGNVVFEQPSAGPKQTGALGERVKELVAQGIPPERAQAVAALQLTKERGVKQQQSAERLGAYMKMSNQALATNSERYAEMKESFPYTLSAKMQGIDLGLERLDLAKERQAFSEGKSAGDALKIVDAATKAAASLAGKKSTILMGLGLEDDEATIRRNLIQEMSGGADPDTVEALAKGKATSTGAGGTATKPATQHASGSVVKTKDGTYHKVLRTQTDGKLVLDPTPVAAPGGG